MAAQTLNTALEVSVVICAHNPRADYFARVLMGLRKQTLALHRWELLIVDNASQVPIASGFDVSWHPTARHIVEHELGVSCARRRGIHEASAGLIIFVDDDNVLDEHYLSEALRIGCEWPFLGVWGSGCIRGEFEVEPRDSFRSWLPVREVAAPRWSNLAGLHLFGESPEEAIPWGAGQCVRKGVAIAYCRFCDSSSLQISSRQGEGLFSGEDTEIAFVCCSRGLGVGVFPELKIIHLIPQRRVEMNYIVRFAEAIIISNIVLRYKWQRIIPESAFGFRSLLSLLKTVILYRGADRAVRLAMVRAMLKANRMIKTNSRSRDRQIDHCAARLHLSASVGVGRANSSGGKCGP